MKDQEQLSKKSISYKMMQIVKEHPSQLADFLLRQLQTNLEFSKDFSTSFRQALVNEPAPGSSYYEYYLRLYNLVYFDNASETPTIQADFELIYLQLFVQVLLSDSQKMDFHNDLLRIYAYAINNFYEIEWEQDDDDIDQEYQQFCDLYEQLTKELLSAILKNPAIDLFKELLPLVFSSDEKVTCHDSMPISDILTFMIDNFKDEEHQLTLKGRLEAAIANELTKEDLTDDFGLRQNSYEHGFLPNLNKALVAVLKNLHYSEENIIEALDEVGADLWTIEYRYTYYMEIKDYDQALLWLRKSEILDPWELNTNKCQSLRADIYVLTNRQKEAIKIYESLLKGSCEAIILKLKNLYSPEEFKNEIKRYLKKEISNSLKVQLLVEAQNYDEAFNFIKSLKEDAIDYDVAYNKVKIELLLQYKSYFVPKYYHPIIELIVVTWKKFIDFTGLTFYYRLRECLLNLEAFEAKKETIEELLSAFVHQEKQKPLLNTLLWDFYVKYLPEEDYLQLKSAKWGA
ncbi:MAG: hypothetical protein LBV55_03565 [Acholeplasmatales bacterium]|nr:hypothetical protein [Acholeplasmatales bacterium]